MNIIVESKTSNIRYFIKSAKRFLLICILLITSFYNSFSQINTLTEKDSLQHVPENEHEHDKNASSRWIRELKNIIIVTPKNELIDSFNVESPSSPYLREEGRTITKIRIVRLKPFGSSVTDSVAKNVKWFGKLANSFHVNTSEFIIRNALMFREGDRINSTNLAYSERYLRNLKYIDDARVTVLPISEDQAEVVVVVHDLFPYSVNFGTNFASRVNYGITNYNIIGLGFEINAGAFMDLEKDHLMGYEAKLRLHHIRNSFISFQADYLDRYENQRYGFTLRRDFYTPATKYAGHLMFYNVQTRVRYFDPEGILRSTRRIPIRYKHFDAWLGRSFLISKDPNSKQQRNFTVSFGARHMYFTDRPDNAEEHYYRFQNRTTYLTSLSFSQQAFYKANLIYNFGRTEDVPYGYQFSAVGGREVNEMYNRPYLGANFSSGYFIPNFGYLSGTAAYGSFFRKGLDQGLINLELNYFTNLYVLGQFRTRSFINGQYTRQLHTILLDRLVIDDEHGIPGFRNDSILGRQRLNLSLEQNFFTPWNFHEFRFVLYAFGHFSWLGENDRTNGYRNLFSSFGIGIRIRNNHLIFSTLQIQIAHFPNIPKHSRFHYVTFSKETVLQPRDFMPRAPDIIPLY